MNSDAGAGAGDVGQEIGTGPEWHGPGFGGPYGTYQRFPANPTYPT